MGSGQERTKANKAKLGRTSELGSHSQLAGLFCLVLFLADVKVSFEEFRQCMVASCDQKTIITANPGIETTPPPLARKGDCPVSQSFPIPTALQTHLKHWPLSSRVR